jgi:broad specificity phosphatase PhoE
LLRLYLVRHGITVWNQERRMQGHTDVPLAQEGVEQARMLAGRLADIPIDVVWSSDLARAWQTAEAIAAPRRLPVVRSPLLRERNLGEWEGLTREEIIARGDEERLNAYLQDSIANPPPGESYAEVWNRLLRAQEEIRRAHPEGTVVVVGHGGSLRVLLCDALAAPMTSMRHIALDNASLSLIEYAPDTARVRLMNDTGHLWLDG